MDNPNSYDLKKALKISSVCIFTYLINYYIRKLLPVLSTDMIGSGKFTESIYALISSTYMIAYSVGQMINGVVGDYIKPKYMVSVGLGLSSIGLFVFSFVELVFRVLSGFFLNSIVHIIDKSEFGPLRRFFKLLGHAYLHISLVYRNEI